MFDYSLEDTDDVDGANVYNGQNSVMWCNLRDAFGDRLTSMYQDLRSQGKLSYAVVEQMFEEHQSKWPEAIFNEDSWFKYIDPLTESGEGAYLMMAQGSKAEQRKWWLYNRFRYLDSKYVAGDALTDIINLRAYAKGPITVTPYADIYPTVRWESYTTKVRGHRGTASELACPMSGDITDANVIVFSASQLASVGDLSPLKVGLANFANATRLQSIKVGDGALGYSNPNLSTLVVGNNVLLGSVDARNCPNLTGTVDLSGAANVEHVYLGGTAVTSVSLPVGGILKTLSLPDTITNLTVRNQPGITSFTMGDYTNVTTLRVENCGSVIPVLDILDDMAPNSRVRIIGFTTTVSSTQDVEDFFDYLDTMRGLDESGNNLDTAVVSGTINGLSTITGAWLAEMNSRYPDVTITYQHITSNLRYYSYDGSTLLHTEAISDGGNGTWNGSPSRTSTAQYDYTFVGWSRYEDQSTADATATQGVSADRDVYAAYTSTLRTYTVTWQNANGTVLETDTNVAYGTMPSYDGATPTQDGQTSTGWQPAVAAVTGNVTYTATYIPTYQVRFYNGSTLLQTSQVQEGGTAVYTGTEPTSSQEGYAFNGWDKALGPITAATDFYAQFKDTRSPVVQYVEGTMTDYFSDTATRVRTGAFKGNARLKTVETNASVIGVEAFYGCTALTTVDLTATNGLSLGADAFYGCSNLQHLIIRNSTVVPHANINMLSGTKIINDNGGIYVPANLVDAYKADSTWSYYLIYPISEYPRSTFFTEITDSWSDIAAASANGTYASKYNVGDYKELDLGTEGVIRMQLVAKDADILASDTTKTVPMTWVAMDLCKTDHRMNPALDNNTEGTGTIGGWGKSEMRTYVNDTIAPLLPAELTTVIKPVVKYSNIFDTSGTKVLNDQTTDSLWIPSEHEVTTATSQETLGPSYSYISGKSSRRIKKRSDSGVVAFWWTRSTSDANRFRCVSSSGSMSNGSAHSSSSVAIGFCI